MVMRLIILREREIERGRQKEREKERERERDRETCMHLEKAYVGVLEKESAERKRRAEKELVG